MLTLLSFLSPTRSFGTAIFHAVAATIDEDERQSKTLDKKEAFGEFKTGVIKREDGQPKERREGNLPS